MISRLLIATAYLLLPAHGFLPRQILRPDHTRSALASADGMPEQLAILGCDAALWNFMPPGTHRDLYRFVRTGEEEMARRRIATSREIVQFSEGSGVTWDQAVRAWEVNNAETVAAAKAQAKADKMAKAKAKREAEEAEKKAQQHTS